MVKGSGFPLIPGRWQVSSGVFYTVNAIRAFDETVITVTALDGTTQDYTLPAGTDTSIGFPHTSITVVSGLASIADNQTA